MWVKIKNEQGAAVWCNLAHAARIYETPEETTIFFTGIYPGPEDHEFQRETTTDPRSIAEIRAALEGRR